MRTRSAACFEAESVNPLVGSRTGSAPRTCSALSAPESSIGIAVLIVHQSPKMAHKGSLVGMYVRPEARRTGVARRLVEAIIDTARRHVEVVQLTVVMGNEPARRLYAGLGFVEYGVEKRALKQGDRYFDEILMALDLMRNQD